MCRYKNLLDTVSKIVNDNGLVILSEPRFWGMLTDLYPFFQETKLKDVYKDCISKGFIAAVATLSGDKRSVVEFISSVAEANQQENRDELAVCLFSAAIAAGKCSEEDYSVFMKIPLSTSSSKLINNHDVSAISHNTCRSYQSSRRSQTCPPSQYTNNPSIPKKKSSKGNQNNVLWYSCLVIVAVIGIALIFVVLQKYTSSEGQAQTQAASEYEKKIGENEELVKSREDDESVKSVKNIELDSDYESAVRYMKSNNDFKDCKEGYYLLDNSGRLHPVFQLMNDRININLKRKGEVSAKDETISGKVLISKTSLDTIPIQLKVFELNGKVTFMMIEGSEGFMSYYRYFGKLLELYYEKYGLPEVRTYDGMPCDPDKYYYPGNLIEERHEDAVWTFAKGLIRFGLNRILYATTDFLDSINGQFDRTNIEYEERERSKRLLKEQERLQSLREDSLRRIKDHENAIKDI